MIVLLACLFVAAPNSMAADAPTQAEANALLDAWLRAQNEGDFAAYNALYAADFSGIKRVGRKTFNLDRARWMADRGKMFGKPFKVKAAGVHVEIRKGQATIGFVQSWTSGSFHDEGPKRIVATKAVKQLLISREEMLRSRLAPERRTQARKKDLTIRWIVDGTPESGRLSATLVFEGAVSRQYDFSGQEGCGQPGPGGSLLEGEASTFSCSMGDCGFRVSVEKKGRRVVVKESSGCQVGTQASGADSVLDDFKLDETAAVVVTIEKAAD